MSSLKVLRSTC